MRAIANVSVSGQVAKERKWRLFEQLALPLQDELHRFALHLTRNLTDAEDLVQDVYLRAIRCFNQFRKGTNFKAWMFTILRSVFIDGCRKRKLRPLTIDHEIMDLASADDHDGRKLEMYLGSNSETDVHDMFDDHVRRALDCLPHYFRRVLLLADVAGFNYKEIAEVIDCPLGTVRSRLFRARRFLKDYLQDIAA